MYKLSQLIKESFRIYYKKTVIYLSFHKRKTVLIAVGLFVVLSTFYVAIWKAPAEFPTESTITIEKGSTLSNVANQLKEQNIVRSSLWLRNLAIIFNGEKGVLSGDYFFDKKESIWSVAKRITTGDFDLNLIEVVIPEGATNYEIGRILEAKSDSFDREEFMVLVDGKEGYLFPDTYLFLPNVKAKEVARELNNNFIEKIAEIDEEIRASGIPIDKIIKMASILEKEARTTETRRTISGILWERIKIGMALQVDAVFTYANGKNSFTLSTADLREDHPYNTYTNKGLPPTPIANPGLDSILATINPIKSDYLFFLSDMDGEMHYSVTFKEHVRKKNIYLN
ncbi:MAG: endolytic transglycosylase MltG [Parcubacteria group bacterium]|nr:endolytic transglycosylase MltG [Parcubacteria group bacterium]